MQWYLVTQDYLKQNLLALLSSDDSFLFSLENYMDVTEGLVI